MLFRSTIAALWLIGSPLILMAQGYPQAIGTLQRAVESYRAYKTLTRSGDNPLPCKLDLENVIEGSIAGCVPVRTVKQDPNIPPKRSNYTSQEGIPFPDPSVPAALDFKKVGPHVTMSLKNLETGPRVSFTLMPIYPDKNLHEWKQGVVIAIVKVTNGSLDTIKLVSPKGKTTPFQTSTITSRIPSPIPIPSWPISKMSASDKAFVKSVLEAVRLWRFDPESSSTFELTVRFTIN